MFSPCVSRASLALAGILSLLASPASAFAPAGIVRLSSPRSQSILAGVGGGARKMMPLRRQGQRSGTEFQQECHQEFYIRTGGWLVCTPLGMDPRWNRGSWSVWISRLLLIDAGFVRIRPSYFFGYRFVMFSLVDITFDIITKRNQEGCSDQDASHTSAPPTLDSRRAPQ